MLHRNIVQSVLRFYNLTFMFVHLVHKIIGQIHSMSHEKLFGCHYHSLTIHAPATFRLFPISSLIPGTEESLFHFLWQTTLTSSKRLGEIIPNALNHLPLHYERCRVRQTNVHFIIAKQAPLISPMGNTHLSQMKVWLCSGSPQENSQLP